MHCIHAGFLGCILRPWLSLICNSGRFQRLLMHHPQAFGNPTHAAPIILQSLCPIYIYYIYMRWSHPFQITSSIPEPSLTLVHQHRLLPRPRSVGNKSARYDPWWPPSVEARRVLVKHQRWPYQWSPPLGSPRPWWLSGKWLWPIGNEMFFSRRLQIITCMPPCIFRGGLKHEGCCTGLSETTPAMMTTYWG